MNGQRGQALPLVLMVAMLILAGGVGLFTLGRAQAAKGGAQSAADLAVLSAGRYLRERLPAIAGASPGARTELREEVRVVAARIARVNGTRLVHLTWPEGASWPPTAVQVTVAGPGPIGTTIPASARAAIRPGAGGTPDVSAGGGGQYAGPLVFRDGKPMCPAVAGAFDRMRSAARRVGVALTVVSGFRTDAEQAVLFARHPDPHWVAPPGKSRHREATELDIAGTPRAWGWLAEHASRFDFVQRYAWEPWHYGYTPGCDAPPPGTPASGDGDDLPSWVPSQYRHDVMASATAGGVPPIILAALLQAESGFDRWAVSPVGAQGIAQFMPATARGMGLRDPFDPVQAIPAAGRLLGGHLRAFGSIPLALAAYNAGPGAVRRFGGVPPYAETRAYVTRIMALAGDPTISGGGADAAGVELVRIDGLLV